MAQRGSRAQLDERRPYGYFVENERTANGEVVPVATILLTNRECPWRCVMCDLWKNTLATSVERGAIPAQIDFAFSHLGPVRQIKLYNSGSFFDRAAIPFEDLEPIAERLRSFERVIVECHPALVGKSTLHFRDLLQGRLEVAMGLETAHPEVLKKLNKGMTLEQYSAAADLLIRSDIDLRSFILVQPPFLPPAEALFWAQRSLDFAFQNGAGVASLIQTRSGNGAMEVLEKNGLFTAPGIATLETALAYGLSLAKGRVFADVWELQPGHFCCRECIDSRVSRLQAMNRMQEVLPPVTCRVCRSNG